MTRIINNYSFWSKDAQGTMVDLEKLDHKWARGKLILTGTYTEVFYSFLEPMEYTFDVLEITEKGVVTQDGIYQLGTINRDYYEYLRTTRSGIQAVANWKIYGSKQHGYYLTGDLYEQKKALGTSKVVSRDGNILTIRQLIKTPSGESKWADEEKVFICCNTISK